MRTLLTALLLGAMAILAGCGASTTVDPIKPQRIVAFGDALSTVDDQGRALNTMGLPETSLYYYAGNFASQIAFRYGIRLKAAPTSGNAVNWAQVTSTGGYSFASPVADLRATADQINAFVANGKPGASDMFIITAGTMDVFNAALKGEVVPKADMLALIEAMRRLADAGANHRNIVYLMPPPVARSPLVLTLKKAQPTNSFVLAVEKMYTYAEQQNPERGCNSEILPTSYAGRWELLVSCVQYFPPSSTKRPLLNINPEAIFNLMTGTTDTGSCQAGNCNTFTAYGVSNPNIPVCTDRQKLSQLVGTNGWTHQPITRSACVVTSEVEFAATGVTQKAASAYFNSEWSYSNSLYADELFLTSFGHRLLSDQAFNLNFLNAGWR